MDYAGRPMNATFDKATVHRERTMDYLRGALGVLGNQWLEQPDVTDILVNPARDGEEQGRLYVVRLGHGAEHVGFMAADDIERLIVAVAATMEKEATVENCVIEGLLLLDGSRFTGIMRPVAAFPSIAIRRKASKVFSLAQYVEQGALTGRQKSRIETAIVRRENILIVGGTGAGKTTLGNAVLLAISELTPDHRVCGVEDTGELQNKLENAIFLNADQNHTMQRLIKTALRLFPNRIIIGEVRGKEAVDMMMAWNTGHPGGFCTLHSNTASPEAALMRLEDLVGLATAANMQRTIGEAIDLIVCVELTAEHRRRVSQIVSVKGFDRKRDEYIIQVEGE